MKKIFYSFFILVFILLNLKVYSYSILTNESIKIFLDKGYILSENYTNLTDCSSKRDKYNIEYSDYKRSECFKNDNGFNYFVCTKSSFCDLGEININNTYQKKYNFSNDYKDKLDQIVIKVGNLKSTLPPEKFKIALNDLTTKLTSLEKKYSSNNSIKSMISYINEGINSIEDKNDIDNFFCDLNGSCLDNKNMSINTSNQTTQKNNISTSISNNQSISKTSNGVSSETVTQKDNSKSEYESENIDIVNGNGVDACNKQIFDNYGYQKYSCKIGGGCARDGKNPTSNNPTANPQHAGVCIPYKDWTSVNK